MNNSDENCSEQIWQRQLASDGEYSALAASLLRRGAREIR
jgi:hypothetical protein